MKMIVTEDYEEDEHGAGSHVLELYHGAAAGESGGDAAGSRAKRM